MDPNVLRGSPLVDSQPILYAIDASSMAPIQVLYTSPVKQLGPGGKYNTPIVVNGMVIVGSNKISAFGLIQ